jgi:hypothetical protein
MWDLAMAYGDSGVSAVFRRVARLKNSVAVMKVARGPELIGDAENAFRISSASAVLCGLV